MSGYSKSVDTRTINILVTDDGTDDETVASTEQVLAFVATHSGELSSAKISAGTAFTGQASGASGDNWLFEILKGSTRMASYQTTSSSDVATAGTSMTVVSGSSTNVAARRFQSGDVIYVKATKQNSASALDRPRFDLEIATVYDIAKAARGD